MSTLITLQAETESFLGELKASKRDQIEVITDAVDNFKIPIPVDEMTDELLLASKNNGEVNIEKNECRTDGSLETFRAKLEAAKAEACHVINDVSSQGIRRDQGAGDEKSDLNIVKDQLEKVMTEKNELAGKFNSSVRELEGVKMKAIVEIESLQKGMKEGDDIHETAMAQLKSVNKILEAEVKIQKDYVNELRGTTLKNVQSKLLTEIEVATSNELEKAGMSLSHAIESRDKRWKQEIQEIHDEHRGAIIALRESHQMEVRSLMKQHEELMHITQAEVERILKSEHSKAIESVIDKEKVTQQKQLRNESKKWEQVRSVKLCH